MGKATRWLKSLLGVGGGGGKRESKGDGGGGGPEGGVSGDLGHKKRWSFAKTARTSSSGEAPVTDARQWQRPYMSDTDKEQSRRAIAVAAATAAAADAAVAAAQAAAVVVRMTSQGRSAGAAFAGGRERSAAVKIQAAFRGYLARKALRALRALVKLQALVRGYLVRKQAAEDLQRMHCLFRAQSAVLSHKYRRSTPTRDRSRVHPESRHRRSLERVDETRSEYFRSLHRRKLSSTLVTGGINSSDDSPKIVEVDLGRPKLRTRRLSGNHNSNLPSSSCESSAAEDDSCCYKSSPLLCHIPPRLSTTPSLKNCNTDWSSASLYGGADEYRLATTAHNTPRFIKDSFSWAAVQRHHHHHQVPVTPTKSVCGADEYRRYQAHHHQLLSNHPGYMASTESFSAKLRSLSAPRQRPDILGAKKKVAALYEIMESRASLSGIRMQRSCSQAQEIVGFRTGARMTAEFARELEADHYLQRRW